MNSTVDLLWSLHARSETSVANWAKAMAENGYTSEALLRLMYEPIDVYSRDRLMPIALADIGMAYLSDIHKLKLEYEHESIGDYFEMRIDGWTLIKRCCDLHWEDENDDPGRAFWIRVADDADLHGGSGDCFEHEFRGIDFDEALKIAIFSSGRPLPKNLEKRSN